MSLHLHAHTIKTTVSDLADTLDEWGDSGNEVSWVYVGGRDCLVVVRHAAHPVPHKEGRPSAHGSEDPADLASIGAPDPDARLVSLGPIRLAKATHPGIGDAGEVLPPALSVMIEDEARTWIMWCKPNGRPSVLWDLRDEDGGVIGEPIRFDEANDDLSATAAPVRVYDEIDAWVQAHPDLLVGAESNKETVVRLLNAAYDGPNPESVPDPLLPARTDGRGVTTRGLLRVAGSESVTADHQVYVRVLRPGGGNDVVPATSVETVNGGHGICLDAPVSGVVWSAFDELRGWMEDHTDLIGEGSAVENVLRLLDHAYNEEGCEDPRYLSDHTPRLQRVPTETVTYSWHMRPRSGDYDDLGLQRQITDGAVGHSEEVWSAPIYRHAYSPEDVARLLRDLAGALTTPRGEKTAK